jgi:hypothetical protein
VLDGEFVADPTAPDDEMWTRVRALLEAADDVLLAAARGTAARSADARSTEANGVLRPGIVLPLIRSSR